MITHQRVYRQINRRHGSENLKIAQIARSAWNLNELIEVRILARVLIRANQARQCLEKKVKLEKTDFALTSGTNRRERLCLACFA
jgi:hypothetical protein